MHSKTLNQFLKEGTLPQSTREKSALFDELRNQILLSQNQNTENTNMNNLEFDAENARQQLADVRATHAADFAELARLKARRAIATNSPAPVARPALARAITAAAKPAPAPAVAGLTSAAAFAKPQMSMLRSEWNALSAADKSRYFKEGGKLVEPQAVKPTHKNGMLTRAGFDQLSATAKSEFFAKGNKLAD
jgi:hypothetical protein